MNRSVSMEREAAASPPTPSGEQAGASASEFARAVHEGLGRRMKSIPPKFFYDQAGSVLFDRICDLPEYYPTRTELSILRERAGDIARVIGPGAEIIEFGAGSLTKVRLLLDALEAPACYVPIDISGEHLEAAATRLRTDYRGLEVHPVVADYTMPLVLPSRLTQGEALRGVEADAARGPAADAAGGMKADAGDGLRDDAPGGRRVGFFPGSTLGNFMPEEALAFLQLAQRLLRGGGLLLGVDLVKEPSRLHAAYNDAQGVTAAFNLNLLARANAELDADFDLDGFAHAAFYHAPLRRIEMHLVSRRAQRVRIEGRSYAFDEGETIHTEYSHKFTIDGLRSLARRAGFQPRAVWVDAERLFSVHWLESPGG